MEKWDSINRVSPWLQNPLEFLITDFNSQQAGVSLLKLLNIEIPSYPWLSASAWSPCMITLATLEPSGSMPPHQGGSQGWSLLKSSGKLSILRHWNVSPYLMGLQIFYHRFLSSPLFRHLFGTGTCLQESRELETTLPGAAPGVGQRWLSWLVSCLLGWFPPQLQLLQGHFSLSGL